MFFKSMNVNLIMPLVAAGALFYQVCPSEQSALDLSEVALTM